MSLQYRLRGHQSSITCLNYTQDPYPHLISADESGEIRIWSSSRRRSEIIRSSCSKSVTSVSLGSDQKLLAQNRIGDVAIFDIHTSMHCYDIPAIDSVYSFCRISVHDDKHLFATPNGRNQVIIRSISRPLPNQHPIVFTINETDGRPMSLCWIDSNILAIGLESGLISYYDIRSNHNCIESFRLCKTPLFGLIHNPLLSATLSGSSTSCLYSCQFDRSSDHLVSGPDIIMPYSGCNHICSRSDHRLFSVCTWQNTATIYTWKSRRLVAVLDQHKDKINDVCFSDPVPGLIATAGQDHIISVYALKAK